MGLDMYLTKRHYVKNWDFMSEDEKHQIIVKKNNQPRTDIDVNKISSITEDVMYWRKANEIHRWFVENCQGGEDDCRETYVDIDQLKELLSLINRVFENKDKAPELLPTASGFFFGGTDYDESYFQELTDTKEMIEKELTKPPADYYYHSSW